MTNQNNSRPVLQIGHVPIQSKYFKDATINGVSVRAYIDMGAVWVAMRSSEVDKLSIDFETQVKDVFVGYGFGLVQSLGRFEANLCIDGVVARVPVNVVPDEIQEIPLLVGHPFTE